MTFSKSSLCVGICISLTLLTLSAKGAAVEKRDACYNNGVGVSSVSYIPDSQMSASSQHGSGFQAAYGRLSGTRGDGWCAKEAGRNDDWLKVNLGKLIKVCAVATQGDRNGNEWVTDFKLSYSLDGNTWTTYKDENGIEMEFHRKGDSHTVDQHTLPKPVYARYMRFHPTKQHNWNCLRVEVYGTEAQLSTCGLKLSKRIVGGAEAGPGEWRWHAQLLYNNHYICSGSLIDPQWIITSAHCYEDVSSVTNIKITLGSHNRHVTTGKHLQIHYVSKVINHPKYSFPDYDFAMLKLKTPARFNDHVGTICLPQSSEKLPVGTACWETGWGRISHHGQISVVLKELEVIIVDPSRSPYWVPNSNFVTTTRTEGHGTCRGDSGGPVVHERDGRWYLEGVHSWGRPTCAQKGYYDGQADVRTVLQWIEDTIINNCNV